MANKRGNDFQKLWTREDGMFEFRIDDEFKHFADLQITQLVDDPEFYLKMSRSEYKAIRKHIGKPKKILDLGCGLGRMSVFLNYKLSQEHRRSAHFILADVTKESDKIEYGWDPDNSYYNNLDLTAKFAQLHGLSNFRTFNLLTEDLNIHHNIDLVMSYLAVGFHYPIEQYMKTLLNITSYHCVMIFGVRKGQYNLDDYKKHFSSVLIEKNTIDTREEILVLKGKRNCS